MTLPGSASVQSHLSALNSKSRYRDHAAALSKSLTLDPQLNNNNTKAPPVLEPSGDSPCYFLSNAALLRPRIWLNWQRWILSVYIILSLVFFSASLSRGFSSSPLDNRSSIVHPHTLPSSVLNALPSSARLAKLVALHPPPIRFNPFMYLPVIQPHPHEVTACLWAPESKLEWVAAWSTEWLGDPLKFLCPPSLARSHIVNRSDLSRRSDTQAPNPNPPLASSRVGTFSPTPNAKCLPPRDTCTPPRRGDPGGAQRVP
jgi:hypothetical protein